MEELTVIKNGVEYFTVQWVQRELNDSVGHCYVNNKQPG